MSAAQICPQTACRLCDQPADAVGARTDISLFRCRSCGFVSGRPAEELAIEQRYGHYYCSEPPPPPEARYREWLERAERQVGVGRLLEVGAGSGAFARVALGRGWAVDATEMAPAGAERLRQMGAQVFLGGLERAGYAEGQFDFLVSLEVLEHVARPRPHLEALARVSRPRGLLLLTTPNYSGLSRRWLGLRWRVLNPEHLGYFTPRTLAAAVRRAGFGQVGVRSRSLDISTWRRSIVGAGVTRFDPEASARLRDSVEGRPVLRAAKEGLNVVLGWTGLGDSLLLWARK